jgi:hypothetical protein
MGREERLDLTAKLRIAGAGTVEEICPFRRFPADAGGEQLFDTLPA